MERFASAFNIGRRGAYFRLSIVLFCHFLLFVYLSSRGKLTSDDRFHFLALKFELFYAQTQTRFKTFQAAHCPVSNDKTLHFLVRDIQIRFLIKLSFISSINILKLWSEETRRERESVYVRRVRML